MSDEEMARVKQMQQFEQALQVNLEHLPFYHKGLYDRYVQAGFNAEQAFRLVCCQAAGCVRL